MQLGISRFPWISMRWQVSPLAVRFPYRESGEKARKYLEVSSFPLIPIVLTFRKDFNLFIQPEQQKIVVSEKWSFLEKFYSNPSVVLTFFESHLYVSRVTVPKYSYLIRNSNLLKIRGDEGGGNRSNNNHICLKNAIQQIFSSVF